MQTNNSPSAHSMKIAVQGCCHGDLDRIYEHIKSLESKNRYKVDLLLVCGDFQAVRNHQDLECMAVPYRHKALKDFHKYYSQEKTAPILTIVIGGNHEASNYMRELYYGGWLAPNIYYLGNAGCVQVNGIRIAGASGIYKSQDFRLGNYERLPYNRAMLRSIYHIRELAVQQLSLLPSPTIFMSHDWPNSIENYGDLPGLLKVKPNFATDIAAGTLGSLPLWSLLKTLQPKWWFSGHMHTRFDATVTHSQPSQNRSEITTIDDSPGSNPDMTATVKKELDIAPPSMEQQRITQFLALDKCGPKTQFLDVIDIPVSVLNDRPILGFDQDWLAITRAFNPWLSTELHQPPYPKKTTEVLTLVEKHREWVKKNLKLDRDGVIPVSGWQQFVRTGPILAKAPHSSQQPPRYRNPQTEAFCTMLQIKNKAAL